MSYKESRTPASKGKQLDHLRIKQGEDGGHSVEHHYAEDGMTYHKPKSHFFGKDEGAELMAHVKKYAHIDESDRGAEEKDGDV